MLLAPAHRSSGERRMSQRQNAAIAAPAQLLEGPGCGLPWHQLTTAPANAGQTSAKSSRPRIQLLLRDRAAVHPGAGSYQIWRVQGEPAPDRRGSRSNYLLEGPGLRCFLAPAHHSSFRKRGTSQCQK